MSTIRIQTAQNIELEYTLAGVADRLVAYLIDLLMYISYTVLVLLLADSLSIDGGVWTFLAFALPVLFYQLLCEVFLNGQSLGKKVKRIRVVSLDGNQPTLGQYLIRWIFRIVDDMIGSGVVAIVTISISQKAQRVGDMLAGTTVVRTTPDTSFQETIFSEATDDYAPTFQQVTLLSDRDISLIREVVNRGKKDLWTNLPLVQKAYHKTRALLDVEDVYEPLGFLETVIRDYNYLTGKQV